MTIPASTERVSEEQAEEMMGRYNFVPYEIRRDYYHDVVSGQIREFSRLIRERLQVKPKSYDNDPSVYGEGL
jgi:hypothetical protein